MGLDLSHAGFAGDFIHLPPAAAPAFRDYSIFEEEMGWRCSNAKASAMTRNCHLLSVDHSEPRVWCCKRLSDLLSQDKTGFLDGNPTKSPDGETDSRFQNQTRSNIIIPKKVTSPADY
jgi:hypothetical protein